MTAEAVAAPPRAAAPQGAGRKVTGIASGAGREMLGSVQTQSLSPVFIGRDAELARLASVLADADAGESQAVLIGGEAGVGKTRLTEEFLAMARTGAL